MMQQQQIIGFSLVNPSRHMHLHGIYNNYNENVYYGSPTVGTDE